MRQILPADTKSGPRGKATVEQCVYQMVSFVEEKYEQVHINVCTYIICFHVHNVSGRIHRKLITATVSEENCGGRLICYIYSNFSVFLLPF